MSKCIQCINNLIDKHIHKLKAKAEVTKHMSNYYAGYMDALQIMEFFLEDKIKEIERQNKE